MRVRFILGPAGSGKTFRCLAEVREELERAPDGPPLIFLAPKQATYQLERRLLETGELPGYTRLQILSFERLARFMLGELHPGNRLSLSEEGRLMVLRALLQRYQDEFRIFRATARLPGFCQQCSGLLRELQNYRVTFRRLQTIAEHLEDPVLRGKLEDLARILQAYLSWLNEHHLEEADQLLDNAADALDQAARVPPEESARASWRLGGLWLDGFAEMTPQEIHLLAALASWCDRVTLAFCLPDEINTDLPWLSTWSLISRTYRHCYQRLASLPGVELTVETLPLEVGFGRFSANPVLAHLERHWTEPRPFPADGPSLASSEKHDRAESASVCATTDRQRVADSVRLVLCPNPEAEAVLAAREIRRHVRRGGRFRETAVLLRQLRPYADSVRRVFARYDIPFFLDQRESVAHHPLAELTRYAFRLAAFGWQTKDWFGALKTGLVYPVEAEIDRLENEALFRGWAGEFWLRCAATRSSDRPGGIPVWLSRAVRAFAEFSRALTDSGDPTGAELARRFRRLWAVLEIEKSLEGWSRATTSHCLPRVPPGFHATVWHQMNEWLDNVELAFSRETLPLTEWLSVLETGLANLTAGLVPPGLDQVLIGAVDRSRNPDLELVLVLGANEGLFPALPARPLLLTEGERETLGGHRVYLGPDSRCQLGHERFYGYIACTRARARLVLTASTEDESGRPLNPSAFFDHLEQLLPQLQREAFTPCADWTRAEHGCELIPLLLRAHSPSAAPGLSFPRALEAWPPLAKVLQDWQTRGSPCAGGDLSPDAAEKLYGRELTLPVSALEDFAACPFKFLAARGLLLKERLLFEVNPRERGSFQHELLSQFHLEVTAEGRRWRDLDPLDAGRRIEAIGSRLLAVQHNGLFDATATNRFNAAILIARTRRLIEALVDWMGQYRFDPQQVELAFGSAESKLPPWRLALPEGRNLLLRGRMDRVDLAPLPDGQAALIVVIDYKSSARKLDPAKLEHGLDLQLPAYLLVLRNLESVQAHFGVNHLIPAGVFYLNLQGAPKRGATRQEALEKLPRLLRKERYQHRGRFNAEFLDRFDSRTTGGNGAFSGDQFAFRLSSKGRLYANLTDPLTADEFEQFLEHAQEQLLRIGHEVFSGNARVNPYRQGQETACDHCEFRPVCRFDPWVQPYRVLRLAAKHSSPAPA